MAYYSQEQKQVAQAKLKPILAKYGMKGTLSVRHHSTVVLKLREGKINPGEGVGHVDVNPYHYETHYSGKMLEFLREVFAVLNEGNYDNSDAMTDYFNVGWYVRVNFGTWDKPYEVIK